MAGLVITCAMLAIFLDIETTGLDPFKHHAIDVAIAIMDIATKEIKGSYQSLIKLSKENLFLADPESLKINGYTFEEISQGKDLKTVHAEIVQFLESFGIKRKEAVFICQNPGFDRGFFSQLVDVYTQEKLNWPYHWLDLASMYFARLHKKCRDEKKPFPNRLSFSKNDIAKEYGLKEEEMPHKAVNGVNHLIACYLAVHSGY
ncbi:MAG TPA: 3'-5' exonuclease [Parachlamydiaceae bacterium]|nr:3'-5' exonuclease [Parachlamydiaceae bacterium]